MKLFYYTALTAVGIALFFVLSPLSPRLSPAAGGEAKRMQEYRVTVVHDGDTVSIRAGSFAGIPTRLERVRLIGVDAPELGQEPWGRRSKRQLKKLISESNWIVRVELDVEKRDRYGRLLAYLWGRNGRLLNEELIETGYALPYTVPPNVKYAERLRAARTRAEGKRAGFWGADGLAERPGEWRRKHPRL